MLKQLKELFGPSFDTIGRKNNGNYIFRRGYYFRHGINPQKLAEYVLQKTAEAGIMAYLQDCGDDWRPFRGGAPVSKSSHFYVEVKIDEVNV